MKIHCTLVRGPHAGRPGPPLELTIEAAPGCPGGEVQQALAGEYGADELTVRGTPLCRLAAGVPPLVTGAVIVDGEGEPPPGAADCPPSLLLAIQSGPAAGTVLPLRRGRYRIGRSGTEIAIPDAALSREHAWLDVTDTAITIADLGSANGTVVDGKKVSRAAVSTDSLISCGNSTMSIVFGPPSAGRAQEWGTAGSSVAEPLKIPQRAESGNRAVLLVTAGLPLLIGVGLALVTGMWMFLAFTAVSAVSVLVPVVTGRRQRRRLKAAVAAAVDGDRERRRRSAPSAADIVLRGRAGVAVPTARQGGPAAPEEVWLRLGLTEQPANISLEPADPDFEAPPLGQVPFVLPPADLTVIRGPLQPVLGLVRFIIMQLTSYPSAARTRILVHGSPSSLPLPARYFGSVSLSSNPLTTLELLQRGIDRNAERGIMIMIDGVDGSSGLSGSAISRGWHVIDCTRSGGAAPGPVIDLGGKAARLSAPDSAADFLPDLVPERVFDGYCRDAASALDCGPDRQPAVPPSCSLADVFPGPLADASVRWLRGRRGPGLPVPIGMAAAGPRILDLESDGPHLLVAGTTGSGKSELLRSLTAALALCYPPDRINFLFIDFKGGSGLGPLTGLPHCVGMLTDLNRHELDRSLVSLRAEVRRREELLAAVQAPDLAGYRTAPGSRGAPLPDLVLIIDEFRMLVEDAPEALSELMRIAAIGRSLGIHLIMATQRPQGALTADIRANVTTSIALRVQSEMESADIINSRAAASIGVANPGRAFLARGTEEPVEFQASSLAGVTDALTAPGVGICLAEDVLRNPPAGTGGHPGSGPSLSPAQAAAPIVHSLLKLWASMGGADPHRPVAMPLPSAISYPDTPRLAEGEPPVADAANPGEPCTGDGLSAGTWSVRLGWVDQPDQQRISALAWEPSGHGHLALVGGTDSGTDEAVAMAVRQLMEHDVESHLYILDAGATFSAASAQPRVGAVAGLHELRRAVRILERVSLELSRRLGPAAAQLPPPMVLVITGWGSWSSAFRAGPLIWAEDLVQDIIRDGARAQISVLISGDREVVTARFFATIPSRAYFPTGSTEESRLAWPRIPDVSRAPGRAVVFGALAARDGSVAQFYAHPETAVTGPAGVREAAARPFRVESLPVRVSVSDVLARALRPPDAAARTPGTAGNGAKHRQIVVGLGGDELVPAAVRLAPGSVLPILGGPASGKSSLIAAVPGLNPEVSGWLSPGPDEAAGSFWAGTLAAAGTGRLHKDAVLLVDDADLLSPEANRCLMDLHGLGWTVIMTAAFSPSLLQRAPLAAAARGHGIGILIGPRTAMDGDFFGIRFEVEANPPPGRAVLISGGRAAPIQLAAAP